MYTNITGVILAGGRASRMSGKDKGLVQVGDQCLYQYGLSRLLPQVSTLVINANRHQQQYQNSGFPVISDLTMEYLGPLAGILAGLNYAKTEWIVSIPCDVPSFPLNLVEQLWQYKGNALAAYANDGERDHPTFALLHTSLTKSLANYLNRGERKLMLYLASVASQPVSFPGQQKTFCNLNTLEDCQKWQQEQ